MQQTDAQQAMFTAIVESSDDAIISKDLHGTITSWNKAAERMYGYGATETVGKNIRIIIPEDKLREEEEILARLRNGERLEHMETRRKAKDGSLVDVSLTISPIKDRAGRIIGASKIARDIRKQKKFLESLQIINEVSKTISSKLHIDSILQYVTDASTKISGAAFGAFFYNKIDIDGKAFMLYTLSGAPRSAFEKFGMPRNTKVFDETFSGRGIVRSDNIMLDPRYGQNPPFRGMPEGHLPVVSYLAVPVISQSGVVIGGLFFGHPQAGRFTVEHEYFVSSLSSHAAVALENARLYEELNALSQKKDEFISFASHEFKTPLTTIKGYMQLAQAGGEPMPDLWARVLKQVSRLDTLVSELLDLSRIQAGKMHLDLGVHRVRELLNESVDSLAVSSHPVQLLLPDEELFVRADVAKFVQVMTNLLSNAVKYSSPGSLIVVKAMSLGAIVEISVHDQGIGIPAHELPHIFNRFYRINEASKAKGMGLGLFIAKEIVAAHGGTLHAESREGKGSSFYVRLPAPVAVG